MQLVYLVAILADTTLSAQMDRSHRLSPAYVPLIVVVSYFAAGGAQSQILDTLPGEFFVERSTVHAIGFRWRIAGDANRNATVEVAYRRVGASEWKSALPLLRIGGEFAGTEELDYVTPHLFAGSILDLAPETAYNRDSRAIGRGVILPNVNDIFFGKGPDLGAHEMGSTPVVYGPRKQVPCRDPTSD